MIPFVDFRLFSADGAAAVRNTGIQVSSDILTPIQEGVHTRNSVFHAKLHQPVYKVPRCGHIDGIVGTGGQAEQIDTSQSAIMLCELSAHVIGRCGNQIVELHGAERFVKSQFLFVKSVHPFSDISDQSKYFVTLGRG